MNKTNAQHRITLTGVDDSVPLDAIGELVLQHPQLEVGLLLSLTPDGRNRYPDRLWLANAARELAGRCAIHVCGTPAREALLDGTLGDLMPHAPRVQVNGMLDKEIVDTLAARYPSHTIITQFNAHNLSHLQVRAPNHALLVDASGGRGLEPNAWLRPSTPKQVGFAGGLGPGNLEASLARIHPLAPGPYWIDMESSLRDAHDWFDLSIARRVLTAFEVWDREQQVADQMLTAGPGQDLESSMSVILGGP